MHGTLQRREELAREITRPVGRVPIQNTDHMVESVLADIAYTLWPKNTAPEIAALCGCSVRAAERYLGGQREWSGVAIAVIVAEIMRRHAMRNFKIVPKR
jgi:hypothetical protein